MAVAEGWACCSTIAARSCCWGVREFVAKMRISIQLRDLEAPLLGGLLMVSQVDVFSHPAITAQHAAISEGHPL